MLWSAGFVVYHEVVWHKRIWLLYQLIRSLNDHTVEAAFTSNSAFTNFGVSNDRSAVVSAPSEEWISFKKISEQIMAVTIPTKVRTERRQVYDLFRTVLML
jgi:hypothetical protein